MQNPTQQPPRLPRAARLAFEPMPAGKSPLLIIETLLKFPGRIIYELQNNWRADLSGWLFAFALAGMAAYGVVVGSFSGGAQIWIAPAKLVLGTLLSVLICLPSLYIFAGLAGMDVRFRTVIGVLFAAVALSALLLIGFAPVAWIFSQSTDSIPFMGGLHLILWVIAISFGLRLIGAMGRLLAGSGGQMNLWSLIFILVCLQMTTTLRPLIGTSDRFLPGEKKFFLTHWFDSLNGKKSGDSKGRHENPN
ncbi:MAG TPA: hypothetical protein VJU77_11550 [Chthoniobacterales bacterium]|nr:hypothetical protein [Chthoniobacterales bacterium]